MIAGPESRARFSIAITSSKNQSVTGPVFTSTMPALVGRPGSPDLSCCSYWVT
jgi:hypothetical protein